MAETFKIHNVQYKASYVDWRKCPEDEMPQYAFVGRSNVGKSSLINMLTNHKKIAHVSKTPGKTQVINFFTIDDDWYLVDLPGYGYAKSSRKTRHKWHKMVLEYLKNSKNLICTFVLIDSRIPPQQKDMDFMKELGKRGVPFVIIYTKADKLKLNKLNQNLQKIQDEILKSWEVLPDQFISSSVSTEGREEILQFIGDLNNNLQ